MNRWLTWPSYPNCYCYHLHQKPLTFGLFAFECDPRWVTVRTKARCFLGYVCTSENHKQKALRDYRHSASIIILWKLRSYYSSGFITLEKLWMSMREEQQCQDCIGRKSVCLIMGPSICFHGWCYQLIFKCNFHNILSNYHYITKCKYCALWATIQ